MKVHHISTAPITLELISSIVENGQQLALSPESAQKITACFNYLHEKIKESTEPIYGINTGFGSLQNVSVDNDKLETLQSNLLKSHACGTGDEVPQEIVKLMLLLKIQSLSYGHSGVQLSTVERLIDFYNHDVLPVVYTQGSLGASGDLAPLAHLSLPLLGLGEVYVEGKKKASSAMLQQFGWEPLHMKAKEGLALINGTQFMSAYGVHCLLLSKKLSRVADVVAATSIDAFDCRIDPFNELIHQIRPHKGQLETAKFIAEILEGSELISQGGKQTQDPYSFRCVPQVHGASKDAINYVEWVFLTEINAVTDNPNVFPEADKILSGGNFHGQPLALALDFLCLALSELGSISERRTFQLISGLRKLPAFLVAKPGLNSGLMIPQYTAASIASQNKQLCTPASVDSIVSSNGQEDHVSMGANAAVKAHKVVKNLVSILGIEWLNATQALELRKPLKSSPFIEKLLVDFRKEVAFITEDRQLSIDIEKSKEFIVERIVIE
ncbi:histidine ammonia-lyase [Solitalea canadensis]|uniref:Histidine ammonia-lyase n=1 Tax=Solitalea canadensis (strain ATCC 29591 / DSM 3403 / JCM 21819 / LMG 8368 / NBRC 15130 / NCIMB 12057 / USAM 9D) TaxID=929556 RepID=H8KN12_SOLCM|nr:histidine ammonia-lyase [Solitalea canadensis]AFD09091.1 histidine ammonia-lyase [Solitalea canadensis DSM 3403]